VPDDDGDDAQSAEQIQVSVALDDLHILTVAPSGPLGQGPMAPTSLLRRGRPALGTTYLEAVQQRGRSSSDFRNGGVEGVRVVRRWSPEAGDLADVLQRGSMNVVVRDVVGERFAQRLDASAHAENATRRAPRTASGQWWKLPASSSVSGVVTGCRSKCAKAAR
jgi:hypothetical protein